MSESRLVLNECLWVCGGVTNQAIQYPRQEMAALRERGAQVFQLQGQNDARGLDELGRRLRGSDVHVVLIWMRPHEVMSLYPILRERKNFSVVVDDWWLCPPWFSREADYILFRIYSGIPVRLGVADFVTQRPPLFLWPRDNPSVYGTQAALLRLPALVTWPLVDAWKGFDRQRETIRPERLLYFPVSVAEEAVPLRQEPLKYDFSMTGNTVGIWLMRDPFASFRHTFANLYHDRKVLMDLISRFAGKPYAIYDWRKLSPAVPPQSWDDYVRITRESRFVLATGGFHNSGLPKHLEYACLGTPMIGRPTVYEFPWLDDCMFKLEDLSLSAGRMKSLLDQALECHRVLRENCLKWREKILKLHHIHNVLDMLQAQANGEAIPPGYLKPAGIHRGAACACDQIECQVNPN
jgi:hypothetical protein